MTARGSISSQLFLPLLYMNLVSFLLQIMTEVISKTQLKKATYFMSTKFLLTAFLIFVLTQYLYIYIVVKLLT